MLLEHTLFFLLSGNSNSKPNQKAIKFYPFRFTENTYITSTLQDTTSTPSFIQGIKSPEMIFI